jgi:hypothetical protein
MVALAFFATAINYLDRQALSVAAPVLMTQLMLGPLSFGSPGLPQ